MGVKSPPYLDMAPSPALDTLDGMDETSIMRQALALARRGEGFVEPNPMVGCVIVRDGRVVGRGWHRRFGEAHAEVEALAEAGPQARGATAFVTLEPCCHTGKTPPCTEALIRAGVARLVAAMEDPFSQVAGKGLARLRDAGVEVDVGLLVDQALRLNAPFIKRVTTGLPYVICKWAATVDGAIATRTGDSRWISNERSRKLVHRLRGRVDAVIIGMGTVIADDPLLTARGVRARRTARRVVIDPKLEMPLDCQLVRSVDAGPVLIATSKQAAQDQANRAEQLKQRGVEVLSLPMRNSAPRRLDLQALLRYLVETCDATNVLVEGGGRTHGAFIQQKLVDELMVFLAPRVLGDSEALGAIATDAAIDQIRSATRVELEQVRRIEGDVLMRYRIAPVQDDAQR